MAVVTEYELSFVQTLDVPSSSTAMDLTELANGGFAGLGDVVTDVDAVFFDGGLFEAGVSLDITGLNGSLDQLANGNVVIATEVGGSNQNYRIVTATGATVLATPPRATRTPRRSTSRP